MVKSMSFAQDAEAPTFSNMQNVENSSSFGAGRKVKSVPSFPGAVLPGGPERRAKSGKPLLRVSGELT